MGFGIIKNRLKIIIDPPGIVQYLHMLVMDLCSLD